MAADSQHSRRSLCSPSEIAEFLNRSRTWKRVDNHLFRRVKFSSYMDGISYVNRLAKIAEEADHHPDLLVNYRVVEISLTTHDAGGITPMDIDFADRAEEALQA